MLTADLTLASPDNREIPSPQICIALEAEEMAQVIARDSGTMLLTLCSIAMDAGAPETDEMRRLARIVCVDEAVPAFYRALAEALEHGLDTETTKETTR